MFGNPSWRAAILWIAIATAAGTLPAADAFAVLSKVDAKTIAGRPVAMAARPGQSSPRVVSIL